MLAPTAQNPHTAEVLAFTAALSRKQAVAGDENPICFRVVCTRNDIADIVPAHAPQLAPFSLNKGTGTERLPSVKAILRFFAEGTDDTPPPSSVHCLARNATFNPDSQQLPPFLGVPRGPRVRLTPPTPWTKQAPYQLLPSSGPVRPIRTHFTPVIADYACPNAGSSKGETEHAPRKLARLSTKTSQDQYTKLQRRRYDRVPSHREIKQEDCSAPLPPFIKAIPSEMTKKYIPEWPWEFYACDIKAGLEFYDTQVDCTTPADERQALIAQIFDEAHPRVTGPFKTWYERLKEPRARDLLVEYAKLGRAEKGTFIEYDRERRGNRMFNVSRPSSGYRVPRGSNDFRRRGNRIRATPEGSKPFELMTGVGDTKPQNLYEGNSSGSVAPTSTMDIDGAAQLGMSGMGNESSPILIE